MLSVASAQARLLQHFQPLPEELIPLSQASGRVLARDIVAAQSLPPFANSSMDGYAVRAEDVRLASPAQPVTLPVRGDIPAGSGRPPALPVGAALRIMTGAPVPEGADAIVPVEDTDDQRGHAHQAPPSEVRVFKPAELGANVRPIGQDARVGETVLQAGAILRAAELGVLAAVGQARAPVHRAPRVALFSTGNELRAADEDLGPGQIRDTNSVTLAAAIEQYGGQVIRLGIARDEFEAARAKLLAAVDAGADLIVSSAGVSVGAYDVVKAAVEVEGALDFWRVRMRPGKPVAFGHVRGIPFVGLPGNPVSALVSFEVFVRPALLKLGGHTRLAKPAVTATLEEPLQSDGRESYLRVVLTRRGGQYFARSTGDQGSAILTSLVKATGLLIVPEGVTEAKAGELFTVWVLNSDKLEGDN